MSALPGADLPALAGLMAVAAALGAAGAASLSAPDPPLAPFAVILAGSVWMTWRLWAGGLGSVRPGLLAVGLGFSAAALGSLLVAREPSGFAIDLALAPVWAALVAGIAGTAVVRRVAPGLLAGLLALMGVVSLAYLALGTPSPETVVIGDQELRRIFPAAFGHPNQFAAALALLLPFAFVGTLRAGGWWARIAYASATALGLAAVVLTYSRAVLVAVALAFVVVAATRRARLVLLAGGALLTVAAGPRIVERFRGPDTLDNVRAEIWSQALRVIADNPLLGVGVENFPAHAGDVILPKTADPPPHAHNLVLTTASEIGLVGAAALVAALVLLTVALVRRLPRLEGDDRTLALGCLGALVAAMAVGVLDAVIYHNVQTLLIAAAVTGLAAAVTIPQGSRG